MAPKATAETFAEKKLLERIVNHWVNREHNYEVYVLRGGGRAYHVKGPIAESMDRLTMWISTLRSLRPATIVGP